MRVYLGLGSNLGDRLANLQAALNLLDLRAGKVLRFSKVYETAPLYFNNQPAFLNAVVEIETHLEPKALLKTVKKIEQEIGRMDRKRNHPREIDIDILSIIASEESSYNCDQLNIPHPQLSERRFVLQPLVDLDPEYMLHDGRSAMEVLQSEPVQSQQVVVRKDAILSIHCD